MKFAISRSSGLHGEIQVAGDKSISHRSIIFGAIAEGTTRVSDLLEGEDVLATISAFRKMGVSILRNSQEADDNNYVIQGVGLTGLQAPQSPLDMGNSGTAFRLLGGLLCAQPWGSTLIGDASLSSRPMGRIMTPLSMMGAEFKACDEKPPLEILASDRLQGIDYVTPMASAQVKSAILLAGLYINGVTSVTENAPTRDHTERMLNGFGYPVDISESKISLSGGHQLNAQTIDVPADLSSAAFFMLAGLIIPGSEILLKKVGVNPSRNGVLRLLQRMGGDIVLENQRLISGEPVADIHIKSSQLQGIDITGDDVALSIDEIPVIAVAAACAEGESTISDAEELRVKESDRISSVVQGLEALGVDVTEHPDGMTIQGGASKGAAINGAAINGGVVNSFGDHRIAMAFAIAGAVAESPVEILNCDNVATSFPNFYKLAQQAGVDIVIQ